jgi:A/G-specific adenine glycosylase
MSAQPRGAPGPDVAALLVAWFKQVARDLPWRRTADPYRIWVSEVMLQQTQVATVIPYFEKFVARFPMVEALAEASEPDVLAHWSGLGYYSRARMLHRAAKVIAHQHGGKLPGTAAALRELPGFGPYTAGAVASIAFGEQTPLVDGNVVRVLSRLFAVEGDPSTKPVQEKLWKLAGGLVPAREPGSFNQSLMELGALVCTPRNPTCLLCPVRVACAAQKAGQVARFPFPKAKKPRKALAWTCAVVFEEGKVLLGRRPQKGLFGGLWELPSAEGDAAKLSASLGPGFTLGAAIGKVSRTLTHRDLTLSLVHATRTRPMAQLGGYLEYLWVTPKEAGALGMSTAMSACLELAFPMKA